METRVDTFDKNIIGAEKIGLKVLGVISFSHFLNDMLQSLIPAIYPLLKDTLSLSFAQIGLITLTYQITASLLQPAVGLYTDHHPKPYSLSIGMGSTLMGMIILSLAPSYGMLLFAVALVGMGSSVFHPESSRVARMASAGKYGLAQSIFQVGGNAGTATGPLLAALIVIHRGPAQHCLVLAGCSACHADLVAGRRLVQTQAVAGKTASKDNDSGRKPRKYGSMVADADSAGSDILEIFLYGQLEQLLHILPDQQILSFSEIRTDPPIRVFARCGSGDHIGWTRR